MYNTTYNKPVKTLSVSEFQEQCLQLLEQVPAEGILITKRGRPVAKLTPVSSSCVNLIGSVKNLSTDPQDDLFSTGLDWDAQPRHAHSD